MPPMAENCWGCSADMTALPAELRKEFCWVYCPRCWLAIPSSPELAALFRAACVRHGLVLVEVEA